MQISDIFVAPNFKMRALFTNSKGGTSTILVNYTVIDANLVNLQPIGQSAAAGDTVTFTAAATGIPTPVVQWQLRDVGANGAWTNIAGQTAATTQILLDQNALVGSERTHHYQVRAVFT